MQQECLKYDIIECLKCRLPSRVFSNISRIYNGADNDGVYRAQLALGGHETEVCIKISRSESEYNFYKNYHSAFTSRAGPVAPECYELQQLDSKKYLVVIEFLSGEGITFLETADAKSVGRLLGHLSLLKYIPPPNYYAIRLNMAMLRELRENLAVGMASLSSRKTVDEVESRFNEVVRIASSIPIGLAHNDVKLSHIFKVSKGSGHAIKLIDWGYFHPNLMGAEFWGLLNEGRNNPTFLNNIEESIRSYIDTVRTPSFSPTIGQVIFASYYFAAYQFILFCRNSNNKYFSESAVYSIRCLLDTIDEYSLF